MAPARESKLMFLVWTCVVSCLLFIANQPLVGALYLFAGSFWPELLESQGARQFALLLGPILLLFAEWWLIDRFFFSMGEGEEEE